MTIAQKIQAAGIPASHHASARRAFERILKKSKKGPFPKEDLVSISEIVNAALKCDRR